MKWDWIKNSKRKRKIRSSEEDEKQSIASLGSALGEHKIPKDKKQFYVAHKQGRDYFYWLKSREGEFPPQETLNTKEKMMDKASV